MHRSCCEKATSRGSTTFVCSPRSRQRAGPAVCGKTTPRIAELFERQPRLFEPEHAFHFGLLEEQEALKEVYRARRHELGTPSRAN